MRVIAQREDIRDLILDGVDLLLARYGFQKMTVEDIARQVGIGKGTIYLHFPSKEELTLSHIDRIVDQLLVQLRLIAQRKLFVGEKIVQMLQTRVLFRFDAVKNYSQSLNDLLSSLRPALIQRREKHFEKEAEVFCEVLEEGTRTGRFQISNPIVSAQVLIWSTNSLLPYSLTPRELGKRKEVEEQVTQIAEHLVNGLINRSVRQKLKRTI
jgi:AcrR family transcriptional regulator